MFTRSFLQCNLFAMCNCNASRLLAHTSPSSPVSVGILPLNRTLLVGTLHIDRIPLVVNVIEEQFPSCDDPFTDTVSAVG